jgi:hypothetical protein
MEQKLTTGSTLTFLGNLGRLGILVMRLTM